MKKWLIAAALAVAGLTASDARAQAPTYVPGNGSCPTGDCAPAPVAGYGYGGHGGHVGGHLWTHGLLGHFGGGRIAQMPTLPVYMAAPWYLYWPYDGHFQTVAPMAHGLYYPPPLYTGNPYLPGAYPGYVPANPVPAYPAAPMKP